MRMNTLYGRCHKKAKICFLSAPPYGAEGFFIWTLSFDTQEMWREGQSLRRKQYFLVLGTAYPQKGGKTHVFVDKMDFFSEFVERKI